MWHDMLHKLDMNGLGKRIAGNPHDAFDETEAGNEKMLMAIRARRPETEGTNKLMLELHRASTRPYMRRGNWSEPVALLTPPERLERSTGELACYVLVGAILSKGSCENGRGFKSN